MRGCLREILRLQEDVRLPEGDSKVAGGCEAVWERSESVF